MRNSPASKPRPRPSTKPKAKRPDVTRRVREAFPNASDDAIESAVDGVLRRMRANRPNQGGTD